MRRDAVKRWSVRLGVLLTLALALGCGSSETGQSARDADATAEAPRPVVPVPPAAKPRDVAVLEVVGLGEIRIELLPELAPRSVESFTALAERGFYDGTLFHRVIPGFMIQGGDPNSLDDNPENDGRGGPGYTLPDEFSAVSFVRGIVGMARTQRPHSAGSQFFIVHDDARHLDGHYTVFGRVVSGMDVVDAITQLPIDRFGRHGPRDRPREPVVVSRVRIEAPGAEPTAATRAGEPPPPSPEATTTPEPGAAAGRRRDEGARQEWDEG